MSAPSRALGRSRRRVRGIEPLRVCRIFSPETRMCFLSRRKRSTARIWVRLPPSRGSPTERLHDIAQVHREKDVRATFELVRGEVAPPIEVLALGR